MHDDDESVVSLLLVSSMVGHKGTCTCRGIRYDAQLGFYLQTRAFNTGSSGGSVVNDAGDIVAVVSNGGGLRVDRPVQRGDVAEHSKARPVQFLRPEHG